MDQDRFTGLKLGIVKQHVFDSPECHRRKSRSHSVNAGRCKHELPGGNVDLFLRKTI